MDRDSGTATPLHRDRNLLILFGVTLMAVMGVTSVAPTLPTLIANLDGAHEGNIGLVVTVFTLPGVLLTPLLGILADRVGRKRVLIPSLLLFGLAGPACALAQTFDQLLLLRLLQGMGAAALGALNVTIISDLYTGHARAAALGLNAGVLSCGVALYPLLGGTLAWLDWRYTFLLPLLALPLAVVVLRGLRNPEPENGSGLGAYFRGAWQGLRRREVLLLFASSLATFILLYGPFLTYLPVTLGQVHQATPLVIGLIMSLAALSTGLAAGSLGRLTRRFPEHRLLTAAFLLYALACLGLALMPGLWWFLLPVILLGMGQGLNMPCVQSMLAGLAPSENRAGFMALNGTILRLGQTLGPLLTGLLFAWQGTDAVFYGGALLALAVALTLGSLLRPRVP